MFQLITQHQFWLSVAIYWIFSAAVSAMPAPSSTAQSVYVWLYRFCHTLAGNVTTVFGNKIPGVTLTLIMALVFSTVASGCAPKYVVHPGAVNTTDSAAYDALMIAQTTIDQARTAYQAGQLPVSARDPLNALVQSYNLAHESWLTYRGAVSTNLPSDQYLTQLNTNIINLTNAILAFRKESQ